ncbi:MAG: SCO family protein, partial [Deltaproteobacteria bacterium]|nr:SCO family protein [Deltaproteobacteria bacterium]
MNAAYLLKRLLVPVILLLLLIPAPGGVLAGTVDPAALRDAVEKSVKAEGVKLDDYDLVDQDGVKFRLSDYFKDGKPLLISFIYTSCPTVCPTISTELKKAVDEARDKFQDRFNVLTIGFDAANDTPEKLKEYGRKLTGDFRNFRLATSDEATIRRLTSRVG